jgi:DNA-binding GntR family transcriptional regulator
MDERIKQKSLAEHIVEDLERKIIDGTLTPGQRLIEQTLCDALGVSRAPVREAFQILENRGFVVREPRKGVSVAQATRQEAEDIYRIRASLEGLATALAIQKRTPELLEALKALHQRMVEAAAQNDLETYHQLNQQFHTLIIGACGNRRLIQLIETFDKQTMRYRLAITSTPGWMEKSQRFHAATIASFEAGDAEAADRIRRGAILGQIERFRDVFANGENSG